MALTLLESTKLRPGDIPYAAVVRIFAETSDILMHLPFDNIDGNALSITRQSQLPSAAFRGINEAYTASEGKHEIVVETLKIIGGDIDVDQFILATQGDGIAAAHVRMKIAAIAQLFALKFVKGDQGTDPREFYGLQARCAGAQVISNGSSSGGDPLKLSKLDELIDSVDGPTHLIMSKAMKRRLTAASRLATVGGHIDRSVDAFGRPVTTYADLPILIADPNGTEGTAPLAFNEAATGGAATATSIYCVAFREGMFTGIQSSKTNGPDTRALGELDTTPAMRNRIEWYCSPAELHPRSKSRLRDVSDAAVVV